MRPAAIVLCVCILFLSCCTAQTYEPTWTSLDSRPLPQWWQDAKFGIFIHWGVYSVPAWAPVGQYAEWYWYRLANGSGPTYDFHVKTYGSEFTYPDFAPMFRAELWDPDFWAYLFQQSGARYVVPTSKHHHYLKFSRKAGRIGQVHRVRLLSRSLTPSGNWNSVDLGPGRDLIGELAVAVRARGLHFGAYYSLYEWFNPIYRGSDPHQYVEQVMLPQLYDLINRYAPDIIWADGAWEHNSTFWNSTTFLAWLFNNAPNKDVVVVNDRWGNDTTGVHGSFFTAEYSSAYWLTHPWEENSGIDVFSYGLNRQSTVYNYSTSAQLIRLLVRTVAYGGNLLLDIGPAADGTINGLMQDRLLAIGAWLGINGEAIYATRIWRVQSDLNETIFYTQNTTLGTVYALFTEWPASGQLILPSPIPSPATNITLLGLANETLKWSNYQNGGLAVALPTIVPSSPLASQPIWALRMTNIS